MEPPTVTLEQAHEPITILDFLAAHAPYPAPKDFHRDYPESAPQEPLGETSPQWNFTEEQARIAENWRTDPQEVPPHWLHEFAQQWSAYFAARTAWHEARECYFMSAWPYQWAASVIKHRPLGGQDPQLVRLLQDVRLQLERYAVEIKADPHYIGSLTKRITSMLACMGINKIPS